MTDPQNKTAMRKSLRQRLDDITEAQRHAKSLAACKHVTTLPEFSAARVVMVFLSTPSEVDTAAIALRAWQDGKTVVAPKVSWDQRRMLPVEITSLKDGLTNTGPVREPIAGKPVPIELIDLVIVPGLGFTTSGYRIGRGMGFYDRFLAQPEFGGASCGLAFDEQIVDELPLQPHDIPLHILVSDSAIRRFSSDVIQSR